MMATTGTPCKTIIYVKVPREHRHDRRGRVYKCEIREAVHRKDSTTWILKKTQRCSPKPSPSPPPISLGTATHTHLPHSKQHTIERHISKRALLRTNKMPVMRINLVTLVSRAKYRRWASWSNTGPMISIVLSSASRFASSSRACRRHHTTTEGPG